MQSIDAGHDIAFHDQGASTRSEAGAICNPGAGNDMLEEMPVATAIVREHKHGNMEMLINTPVRSIELMPGKLVPSLLIGFIQVTIIPGLGHLLFQVPVNCGLWNLFAITLLFIGASLSPGVVISTIAKSQLQAMQMTVFVLLPSILLSGFMYPCEGMPELARDIAGVLPAAHFMRTIRGVVLRCLAR